MYSAVITTQKVSPFYGQNVMGHLHKTLWILIMSGESIKVFGSRIDFLFFTSEQFHKKTHFYLLMHPDKISLMVCLIKLQQ